MLVGWAFLPTATDEIISGCLKQYFAVILRSAVPRGQECPPYNQACGLALGWQAHPTAFLHFSGSLKPFTFKPC
ncbi:MAG: hypothetical protein IKX14_01135, partial [Neisseriaceae bacterium]|nr:hypothetical protein [Neisseriaceae bacterium]